MISIARTLGAPLSVPAGKQAASASSGSSSLRSCSFQRRYQMHDVRVLLHVHQVADLHRAIFADAAQIVAAEIDQHDVLGALFLVVLQLFDQSLVVAAVGAAARVPAMGRYSSWRPVTRTSISGEAPTHADRRVSGKTCTARD